MSDEFSEDKITPFDPAATADKVPEHAKVVTRPAAQPREARHDVLSDINRALPYSDDAEKGVLSCFLQNPVDLLADAEERLPSESFYHPVNRQIYEELQTFANRPDHKPLDLVTFSQHLIDKGLMDKIGGPSFLAELLSFVPTPAHYPYYRGILRDKWLLRRIIGVCTHGIQDSYEYQEDIEGLIDKIEAGALSIRPRENETKSDDFKDHMAATLDAIQQQMSRRGKLAGPSWGLPWLDEMTGGIQRGFHVIAARPSMGKTALMMMIFESLAIEQGLPVGVVSLEMSGEMLVRRLFAAQAWLSLTAIKKGELDKEQQGKLMAAHKRMQELIRARIDDRAGLTINQIRNKARRWKKQYGIKCLLLDYLQRIGTNNRFKNPRDAHAENSTGLADLSKELDIPIIVLAQLNRDCETEKRKPRMSDVEGCGRIEQDADTFTLLSRTKKQPPEPYNRYILTEIDKNRDGPTGSEVHLFYGPYMRFDVTPIPTDAKGEPIVLEKKAATESDKAPPPKEAQPALI